MITLQTILALAYRETIKFLRNKPRLLLHVGLPIMLVWVLGSGFDFGLTKTSNVEFNYLKFIFAGVLAQNAFQSTAVGLISFVEERKNGFSQTLFVAPINLKIIFAGKILGEILVAYIQLFFFMLIFPLLGVNDFTIWDIFLSVPITFLAGLAGGAFGTFILSNITDLKTASQVAPISVGLQFFLSGVLQPIKYLPNPQLILSRIMPMTYTNDFSRALIFWGTDEYDKFVIFNPFLSFFIISAFCSIFFFLGIYNLNKILNQR